MYIIFTLKFAVLFQILVQVFAENKTTEIKALEKEAADLFKQINNAIDDSVLFLRKNNDSESILGVDYMTKLKVQLKKINDSDLTDSEAQRLVNETRRNSKAKLNIEEISKYLNKKGLKPESKPRSANTLAVQKKIDAWLLQRELEKQKIKEYKIRMKNMKYENCPRFGVEKSRTKKKNLRRNNDGRRKQKTKGSPIKYPCCRKCCKQSYLGCL